MALGPISHFFYKLYLKKSCMVVNGVLAHLWEANLILNIGYALTLCVCVRACVLDVYANVIENKLLVF